ncbi:hypothetical protein ABK040_003181 [Willaertia magna]
MLSHFKKLINRLIKKLKKMGILWYILMIIGVIPLLLILTKGGSNNNNNRNANNNNNALNNENRNNNNTSTVRKRDDEIYSNKTLSIKQEDEKEELKNKSLLIVDTSFLKILAQESDLYLVIQVSSNEEQLYYENLMKERYPFFNEIKILFCETIRGKIAFSRQINPQLCIDVDKETTKELNRFLPKVCMITKSKEDFIKMNEDGVLEGTQLEKVLEHSYLSQ